METIDEVKAVKAEMAALATELAEYRTMLFDPATPQTTKDLLLQTIANSRADLTALRNRLSALEARIEAPAGISRFPIHNVVFFNCCGFGPSLFK